MMFDIGLMVCVCGCDWVVLFESGVDFLLLCFLGGSDVEIVGVYVGEGGEEVILVVFVFLSFVVFGIVSGVWLLLNVVWLVVCSGVGFFWFLSCLGVELCLY